MEAATQRVTGESRLSPPVKALGPTVPYFKWLILALSSAAYWHRERPGGSTPTEVAATVDPPNSGAWLWGSSPEGHDGNCGLMATG